MSAPPPRPPRSGRFRGGLVVAAVAVALLAGFGLDTTVEPTDVEVLRPPATPTPIQGAWYCAAGSTAEGDALDVLAGAVGTSNVHLETFADGEIEPAHQLRLEADEVRLRGIEGEDAEVGLLGIWEGAPAAVARTWRRGAEDEVPGLVHGPCVGETSSSWYLAGVATDGGASARIVVANPFETDAAIDVELLTTDGPETPELLQNVGVPARTTRTIDLNEFAPEREDLGAVVNVRSGRVVAEGWQALDPAIGDISGVALTRLATAPAEQWTVPWLPADAVQSWVTIANVGEQPAAIRLTVHTEDGGGAADEVDEVSVPAGGVRRVDLGTALPADVGQGGLTVTSENAVPIVVAGASRIPHEDEEVQRTGILHLLGHPEPHTYWFLPGVAGDDRRAAIHLLNPTADPSEVDVTLFTPEGAVTAEELSGIAVGPGATASLRVDPHLPDGTEAYGVLVVARTAEVVVALHSYSPEGRRDDALNGGVAGIIGRTPLERRNLTHDPGLTVRLGTSLGIRIEPLEDVLDPDEVEEMPREDLDEVDDPPEAPPADGGADDRSDADG
jgi:hypothetical protein